MLNGICDVGSLKLSFCPHAFGRAWRMVRPIAVMSTTNTRTQCTIVRIYHRTRSGGENPAPTPSFPPPFRHSRESGNPAPVLGNAEGAVVVALRPQVDLSGTRRRHLMLRVSVSLVGGINYPLSLRACPVLDTGERARACPGLDPGVRVKSPPTRHLILLTYGYPTLLCNMVYSAV